LVEPVEQERKMSSAPIAKGTPANLEYPACPQCRSDERAIVYQLTAPYCLTRCVSCGLTYLYPRLAEPAMRDVYRQASYYEGGSSGYSDASYRAQEPALRATFKRLLRNLAQRQLTGGALLEIGCGYGYLLDEARAFFDRRAGTDFSEQCAVAARRTGAEIFVGGVEEVPCDRQFDCVIATQVIEHVYKPLEFIAEILRRTRMGGHIVLATPDIGGVLSKCMGRRWPSLKTPEHVVYFEFETLKSLMERAGLHEVRRLPYPHAFPLGLLAAKFNISLPVPLAGFNIWVPATTVAAYARVSST
jgi:2-polyprenyl-3-methyl-5-hydroxy-6-metoxy-1,4-benzoquinol methylase